MKTYVKPELRFESYELNHSVADCSWELRQGFVEVCEAVADPGLIPDVPSDYTAFTNLEFCKFIPDGYCYQNSETDGIPLFRS